MRSWPLQPLLAQLGSWKPRLFSPLLRTWYDLFRLGCMVLVLIVYWVYNGRSCKTIAWPECGAFGGNDAGETKYYSKLVGFDGGDNYLYWTMVLSSDASTGYTAVVEGGDGPQLRLRYW